MSIKNPSVSMSIAILLIAVLVALAASAWRAQRAAARQAVAELAECRRLAARIEACRAAPRTALSEKQSAQQISLSVQRAAQAAEISDTDILHITPRQGRRLGKSVHVQQPVDVEFRQITLGQLSRFIDELHIVDAGLEPTSIRLTAPRAQPAGNRNELWTCELVLTYLVFSPE